MLKALPRVYSIWCDIVNISPSQVYLSNQNYKYKSLDHDRCHTLHSTYTFLDYIQHFVLQECSTTCIKLSWLFFSAPYYLSVSWVEKYLALAAASVRQVLPDGVSISKTTFVVIMVWRVVNLTSGTVLVGSGNARATLGLANVNISTFSVAILLDTLFPTNLVLAPSQRFVSLCCKPVILISWSPSLHYKIGFTNDYHSSHQPILLYTVNSDWDWILVSMFDLACSNSVWEGVVMKQT